MRRDKLPHPRWETPTPRGYDQTWGPEVRRHAARHLRDDRGNPLQLDGWQARALDRALACDADGALAHRLYLFSTGRQNGKTVMLRELAGWALTDSPLWRVIRGVAYDRQQARIVYDAVYGDATRPRSALARRVHATRMRGIRGPGRREYLVASRDAPNSLRGHTVDLALVDEVLTQRDEGTWAALLPAMSATTYPFAFGASTAGTDRSILLRAWYERGVRICRGIEPPSTFGMTWYGADEGARPDDDAAVLAANPGLATRRISWATIDAERGLLSADGFRRERLNVWTDAADEWLPPGVWARQSRPGEQIPIDTPRIAVAVDVVPSWERATITVAGRVSPAQVHVAITGELDSLRLGAAGGHVAPAELSALVRAVIATWGPALVVWDAAAAVAPWMTEWTAELDVPVRALTAGDIRNACASLYGQLVGGELTHSGDAILTAQVHAARKTDTADGLWRLSRRASGSHIDAILALVFAAYGAQIAELAPSPNIY